MVMTSAAAVLGPANSEELVRLATDEEVRHYWENGWVKMESLISKETAAQMLEVAKSEVQSEVDGVKSHERTAWRDRYMIGRDDKIEPFATVSRSENIARNVQRFARREVPIGYHVDMLATKMPNGSAASGLTGYHQDFPNKPVDRTGMLIFWIALDDLTPDQGVMRFHSGSHKEGPLGLTFAESGNSGDMHLYDFIKEEYPLSPPLHLKAGDCTVHHSCVIHGAPANTTDRPRYTYITGYFPGDCTWTGGNHFIFNAEAGLEVGKPIRSPKFPMILGD